MPGNDDAIALLSDVLEKMIDSQISNTEACTLVNSALDEVKRELSDTNNQISAIRDQFSNGFRSELKEQIREYAERDDDSHKNISDDIEDLKKEVEYFKSVGFWGKVIAAIVTTLGILVAGAIKLASVIGI